MSFYITSLRFVFFRPELAPHVYPHCLTSLSRRGEGVLASTPAGEHPFVFCLTSASNV